MSKTGVGSYAYNAGKPHAVSAAGNNSYGYDANGNMTSRNGATLTYDAENRLVGVSGGASASFVYDGDGHRVKAAAAPSPVVLSTLCSHSRYP